jgi:putative lipoprotein
MWPRECRRDRSPTEGRQVPLPFELRYDLSRIEPNRSYALRAVANAVRHRHGLSRDHARHPTEVDLLLMRISQGTEKAPSSLCGPRGTSRISGSGYWIGSSPGRAGVSRAEKSAGSGSCNHFFGAVVISGLKIPFGSLGSRRACLLGCRGDPGGGIPRGARRGRAVHGRWVYALDPL